MGTIERLSNQLRLTVVAGFLTELEVVCRALSLYTNDKRVAYTDARCENLKKGFKRDFTERIAIQIGSEITKCRKSRAARTL